MSSPWNSGTAEVELRVPRLSEETEEILAEIARKNGRTLDAEAENIIKTHVAEATKSKD